MDMFICLSYQAGQPVFTEANPMSTSHHSNRASSHYLWSAGALGVAALPVLYIWGYRPELLVPMVPCLVMLAYSLSRLLKIVRGAESSHRQGIRYLGNETYGGNQSERYSK